MSVVVLRVVLLLELKCFYFIPLDRLTQQQQQHRPRLDFARIYSLNVAGFA